MEISGLPSEDPPRPPAAPTAPISPQAYFALDDEAKARGLYQLVDEGGDVHDEAAIAWLDRDLARRLYEGMLLIRVTDAGHATMRRLRQRRDDWLSGLLVDWEPDDVNTLARLLRRLNDEVEASLNSKDDTTHE